jgi:hypothetical protein
MSKQSILIVAALLIAVVALATALDLFAPGIGDGFSGLRNQFSQPPEGAGAGPRRELFALSFSRAQLPRAVRSLAGIATLAGYGLLLRYLVPNRLGILARALAGTPAQLARHGLNGLALLLLIVGLILLAAISFVAALLAPLLGVALGATMWTGTVAFAMAIGQRVRSRLGGHEHSPIADLLIGLSIFFLLGLTPYLGVPALLVAGLVGLGAAAATRFGEVDRLAIEPIEY